MTLEQLIFALKLLIGAYFDSKEPSQEEIDFLRKLKEMLQ